MKLGLLNTLTDGRGGGINPDGLSLDLQFATDKTLTARRGPTPVFTRGSGATQINAQGLIEWTPENLVASSENMSAFTRSEVVAPVSVSGGPTGSFSELAVTATNGFHFYRLSVNETTNTTAMMWVLAKRGTARYLRMGGGPASSFDWDTLSWSVTNPAHQTIAPVSHPFGDGWYWLPIFRVSGSNLVDLTPSSTSGTTFFFNQPSVETVLVAAVQLSRSNLPQTGAINYYKTTGTSFYAPRFDHDPVTLACKGLLIEEGRTNICRQSENFGTTWSTFNSSTSLISQVAPNGDPSAYSVVENTGSGAHSIFQSIPFAGTTNYTFSVFVKAGSRNFASLVEQSSGGAQRRTFFNLSTGEVGTKNASHTASMEQLPNGWWRLRITFTSGAASNANIAIELASADNVVSYLGNGSGNVFIWGAQLEAGSFPTSYIPTTTGSVVRSADVCSITGSDFTGFYNFNAGTIVGDLVLNNAPSLLPVLFRSYLNEDNKIQLGVTNSAGFAIRPFIVAGGSQTYSSTQGTTTSGTQRKLALAYATNDAISCLNATLGTQDVSVTPPTLVTIAQIGPFLTGTIAALRYYKKRLPDAKLVTLTT